MPTNPGSPRLINGAAIDPLWLHAPRAALLRDLPYPVPFAKQF